MEEKNWNPHGWKKPIVRRCLSNARREIYRIALKIDSPEDAAGIREAVLAICGAELNLEAVENAAIGATLVSISRKLKTTEVVTMPEQRSDVQFATA